MVYDALSSRSPLSWFSLFSLPRAVREVNTDGEGEGVRPYLAEVNAAAMKGTLPVVPERLDEGVEMFGVRKLKKVIRNFGGSHVVSFLSEAKSSIHHKRGVVKRKNRGA